MRALVGLCALLLTQNVAAQILCPDGTYVGGDRLTTRCAMTPDGSYVSTPRPPPLRAGNWLTGLGEGLQRRAAQERQERQYQRQQEEERHLEERQYQQRAEALRFQREAQQRDEEVRALRRELDLLRQSIELNQRVPQPQDDSAAAKMPQSNWQKAALVTKQPKASPLAAPGLKPLDFSEDGTPLSAEEFLNQSSP